MACCRRSHTISDRLAAVLLTVALVVLYGFPAEARDGRKQILLLNSYHQNFQWNESIFQGLSEVLRPRETGIVLHVENMDTKRVDFDEQLVRQLKDVYELKYKEMDLDLIMVTDNNAFEFMRRHHDDLFPDVPVVFCGLNNFKDRLIRNHPLFTGVAENLDAKGTLWLALNLHPNTRSIYVITDSTYSGEAIIKSIKSNLNELPPNVSIRFSGNLPMEELLHTVNNLPDDSLVLFTVYNRDGSNRFYEINEAIELISEASPVPVYGMLDFDLGHGIVGGMLSSGHFQGQAMAQIALHVLAGRHPKDIPVITEGVSRPMFDFEMLNHHKINMAILPDDAEIINRPHSLYSENRKFIWTGAAFTLVQMIIIIVLIFNTAKRKQAETALRRAHNMLEERVRERTSDLERSEEAMRTIFDASHDAIFIHDVSGVILDANERMLKMYGLTRPELEDISIARDISSRDNAVYRLSSLWRSVLNGEPQFFEWKARKPHDGAEFDVEVYLNRIAYRGKDAILANVRDISVRKESENRIRQSLSKFEAILENSLMGIAMSHGRKLSTINRRGAGIFGYTQGELVGHELGILIGTREEEDIFVEASRAALAKRGEFNTEQAFLHKNGSPVWCRMYAKAVDQGSLDKGVIWAWDDITQYRRAQEDLMQTREAAESANRAKSEFLASMSHEIRTPMNAIVGMTDILLQSELTDEQQDYMKTVMDSAQHLLSIINDILDLSKIEARKLVLDNTDFGLHFHIQSTMKGLEVQGKQKGLDMVLEIAEDAPCCVKGDPLSLRQVLMNLVGNAIKFTHRGTITVRVGKAEPDPHKAKSDPRIEGVRFEVQDTGIGIPDDFMGTIFQSFSQTTRAYGGTGLGLAICKQLIALMGGDICVESKVGEGSTFSFTVWFEPGVACPSVEGQNQKLPVAPIQPAHVLIAEDNEINVMVTTLRLEELGYTFSVASNGLEVLDHLKREPFDLILMDIEMPILDGISTTKAIRSAIPNGPIPNPDIPIIGVTAHALKEFRDKGLDAGMDEYVSKPVNFNELTLIINRLLGAAPSSREERAVPPAQSQTDTVPIATKPQKTDEANGELPVWIPDKAMEDLGVDDAMFKDFVITARNELSSIIGETRQAVGGGNMKMAQERAHTIKSICSSVGAHMAALAAADLESACMEGVDPTETLEQLTMEIDRLQARMAQI